MHGHVEGEAFWFGNENGMIEEESTAVKRHLFLDQVPLYFVIIYDITVLVLYAPPHDIDF